MKMAAAFPASFFRGASSLVISSELKSVRLGNRTRADGQGTGRNHLPPAPASFSSPLGIENNDRAGDIKQGSFVPSKCLQQDGIELSSSCLRREILFLVGIPFVLPLHHPVQALGASNLSLIQMGVRKILSKSRAAGILRLAFHDAGTFDMYDNSGGMNGSIIYELDRPENAGLSKVVKVLDKAKKVIDGIQQVSWADLIAVAGAEAVIFCGGPLIPIQLGRLDIREPDPPGKLPKESLDASGLKRCFLSKGFSTQDLIALSGAHTLGSKGFGNPTVFDNAYFKILLEKPWTSSANMSNMIGLPSDRALMEDGECLRWITTYAADEKRFFNDFKNAYVKLVNLGASWGNI